MNTKKDLVKRMIVQACDNEAQECRYLVRLLLVCKNAIPTSIFVCCWGAWVQSPTPSFLRSFARYLG